MILFVLSILKQKKTEKKNEIGDWTKNHIEKYNGDLNKFIWQSPGSIFALNIIK